MSHLSIVKDSSGGAVDSGSNVTMPTFLAVALSVYGAMNYYLLRKVWQRVGHSRVSGLALTLAGIVLGLCPLFVRVLERQGWPAAALVAAWVGYLWMGYVFLFLCVGLPIDLGRALARRLKPARWSSDAGAFGLAGLLALALLGYGLVEAQQLRVERVSVVTSKLAAGRITIALVSDLHLGLMRGAGLLDRVSARLCEARPDILVATGDIVDGQGDDLAALAARFRSCAPRLGAYAVTGNHEHFAGEDAALRFLRDAGFTVLRGDRVTVGGIVLAGVDDPAARPGRPPAPGAGAPAAAVGTEAFVVLLKHQPVVDDAVPFDLQLSGHLHDGQIFPFVYLTWLSYGLRTGLTELAGGRLIYVSRGAGTWGPPIRLLAPPEITLITIVGGKR